MIILDFYWMHLKNNFDSVLIGNRSTSIGWVELSSVKDEICESCDISDNEFYTYVSELLQNYILKNMNYRLVAMRELF